jgi:hypothetical protein
MNIDEVQQLAKRISDSCVNHANFDQAVKDIQTQLLILQPGEILSIVGPSRVGKSQATRRAFEDAVRDAPPHRSVVWIDNENSQAEGQFSTKAFMLEACKAINHPIYGQQHSMTAEGQARLQSHLARTPEAIFREAFERGLGELGTRYLVVDEAHHVMYARGGVAAASRILDSWKCLAQKTGVVLVLIGSYALTDIMQGVPHLIGRQRRPIEFPRYKSSTAAGILAFDAVLATYSKGLPFAKPNTSLRTWNRQLFEGSLGCVGHLSLWLRSALAWTCAHHGTHLTRLAFESVTFLQSHFRELLAEIEEGEKKMTSVQLNHGSHKAPANASAQGECPSEPEPDLTKVPAARRPFTRKTRRRARGERE